MKKTHSAKLFFLIAISITAIALIALNFNTLLSQESGNKNLLISEVRSSAFNIPPSGKDVSHIFNKYISSGESLPQAKKFLTEQGFTIVKESSLKQYPAAVRTWGDDLDEIYGATKMLCHLCIFSSTGVSVVLYVGDGKVLDLSAKISTISF